MPKPALPIGPERNPQVKLRKRYRISHKKIGKAIHEGADQHAFPAAFPLILHGEPKLPEQLPVRPDHGLGAPGGAGGHRKERFRILGGPGRAQERKALPPFSSLPSV